MAQLFEEHTFHRCLQGSSLYLYQLKRAQTAQSPLVALLVDMSQEASHLCLPSQNRGRELCVLNDAPKHCRMSSNMYAYM